MWSSKETRLMRRYNRWECIRICIELRSRWFYSLALTYTGLCSDRNAHEWGRVVDDVANGKMWKRKRDIERNFQCYVRFPHTFHVGIVYARGATQCDITVSASYYNILWLNTNIQQPGWKMNRVRRRKSEGAPKEQKIWEEIFFHFNRLLARISLALPHSVSYVHVAGSLFFINDFLIVRNS